MNFLSYIFYARFLGTRGTRVKSSLNTRCSPSYDLCVYSSEGNETRRDVFEPFSCLERARTVNRVAKGFRAPVEPRDTFNNWHRDPIYFVANDIRAVAARPPLVNHAAHLPCTGLGGATTAARWNAITEQLMTL